MDKFNNCQKFLLKATSKLTQRKFPLTIFLSDFGSHVPRFSFLPLSGFFKEIIKFIFNWRIIAPQYCVGFCHTLTGISHSLFQFYCGITDIEHYISLRCVAPWFDLRTSWNDYHNNFSEHSSSHIESYRHKVKKLENKMFCDENSGFTVLTTFIHNIKQC